MCNQPSTHAQYPLSHIIIMHPFSSGVMRNITLRAPNTDLKYGDPKFPNEKPVYPQYMCDSRKIALLEFPKL